MFSNGVGTTMSSVSNSTRKSQPYVDENEVLNLSSLHIDTVSAPTSISAMAIGKKKSSTSRMHNYTNNTTKGDNTMSYVGGTTAISDNEDEIASLCTQQDPWSRNNNKNYHELTDDNDNISTVTSQHSLSPCYSSSSNRGSGNNIWKLKEKRSDDNIINTSKVTSDARVPTASMSRSYSNTSGNSYTTHGTGVPAPTAAVSSLANAATDGKQPQQRFVPPPPGFRGASSNASCGASSYTSNRSLSSSVTNRQPSQQSWGHKQQQPVWKDSLSATSSAWNKNNQYNHRNDSQSLSEMSTLVKQQQHQQQQPIFKPKSFQPTTLTVTVAAESASISSKSTHMSNKSTATHKSSFGELSSLRRKVQQKQKHQQQKQQRAVSSTGASSTSSSYRLPMLPQNVMHAIGDENDSLEEQSVGSVGYAEFHSNAQSISSTIASNPHQSLSKKKEWLERMNLKRIETPIGELDPDTIPILAVMNACAKLKSSEGAAMVEVWLCRIQEEQLAGNTRVHATTKMYTMAVDAWAKSGEKGAAVRAESLLQHMYNLYQKDKLENLKPTTGIFNAVINAWARSKEPIAPSRALQILHWMQELNARGNSTVAPDKYTFNTVLHAYAKQGGKEAADKAQEVLNSMQDMYSQGNTAAKPDTITYNVVINCLAKSGKKGAAYEAEKLLSKMHNLHTRGDLDIKPNVITYGAVIDAWAKSQEKGAASRADSILANMIRMHQSNPIQNADLMPNTYVFNTVINCWAKSKDHDAASKAEEMLVAMNRLHDCGVPGLKPDAFTYTAVIDAWSKSGYKGAASRANQLLEKMEVQFQAGDVDLKPNSFTYNAVINALAKSQEQGAAAKAERVLQNIVNRLQHKNQDDCSKDDVKPTTINFNTVLDAWAKSGEKRAPERAEEILEWMYTLSQSGQFDVKPDTITFNAIIDAWARSGDKRSAKRAEQILSHMDSLYKGGNDDVKPDTYTYNTVINAYAKSGERNAASRAEQLLSTMERRYRDGDIDFKPNTRTYTSVIDTWAKSGQRGSASRAEQILNSMQELYESTGDVDVKPNVHTSNAVMNACAFTKNDIDWPEALEIAFRVFDWLSCQPELEPDAYTFTILLSACSNLLPREEEESRYEYAKVLFTKCCDVGYVNHFVLRKLKQTVTEHEFAGLVGVPFHMCKDVNTNTLPFAWSRNVRKNEKGRRGGGGRGNNSIGGNSTYSRNNSIGGTSNSTYSRRSRK